MKMIRPNRLRCMLRDARWATRNAPVRLALMTFSKLSSVIRMSSMSGGDAGVGHQHLDRTLVLLDLGEGAVDGGVVGDVALDAEQTVVGAPDPRCVTATL